MSHANQRGNSRDRATRRQWILRTFGNGRIARCWECGTKVTADTLVVDRIVPGKFGGKYVRGNIRPQCHQCSDRQGYALGMGTRQRNVFDAAMAAIA